MNRGVKFRSNLEPPFLSRLPVLIHVKPFDWVIDDTEIYNPGQPEGRFTGELFEELLKNGDEYNFVRIRRYPVDAAIADVSDYNEYLSSECSFVLLCYDGGFYEIYDKDVGEVEAIYKECLRLGFDNVRITTDENDGRYCFHF